MALQDAGGEAGQAGGGGACEQDGPHDLGADGEEEKLSCTEGDGRRRRIGREGGRRNTGPRSTNAQMSTRHDWPQHAGFDESGGDGDAGGGGDAPGGLPQGSGRSGGGGGGARARSAGIAMLTPDDVHQRARTAHARATRMHPLYGMVAAPGSIRSRNPEPPASPQRGLVQPAGRGDDSAEYSPNLGTGCLNVVDRFRHCSGHTGRKGRSSVECAAAGVGTRSRATSRASSLCSVGHCQRRRHLHQHALCGAWALGQRSRLARGLAARSGRRG